jgi:hypothetical protein
VRREPLDVFFRPPCMPKLSAASGTARRRHDSRHDSRAIPLLTLPSRKMRLFGSSRSGSPSGQARRILKAPDHAARDLERVHGIPRSRITVATEAPSSTFYPVPAEECGDLAAAATRCSGIFRRAAAGSSTSGALTRTRTYRSWYGRTPHRPGARRCCSHTPSGRCARL